MEDYLLKSSEITVPDTRQIRDQSVRQLGATFSIDERHAHHVMTLASRLFDSGMETGLHTLSDSARELLIHAAYLHDIGRVISLTGHHHHSYYLITNASVSGFQQDELNRRRIIQRRVRVRHTENRSNAAVRRRAGTCSYGFLFFVAGFPEMRMHVYKPGYNRFAFCVYNFG